MTHDGTRYRHTYYVTTPDELLYEAQRAAPDVHITRVELRNACFLLEWQGKPGIAANHLVVPSAGRYLMRELPMLLDLFRRAYLARLDRLATELVGKGIEDNEQ